MEAQLTGGLTQEHINALKQKHGTVTLIIVDEGSDNPINLFFKKPDMKTLSAVVKISERDPIAGSQLFFRECLVHGDKSLSEDVEIMVNVSPHIQELIGDRQVTVKNL